MNAIDAEWLAVWQAVVLYLLASGVLTWLVCGLFERKSQAKREAEDNEQQEALARPSEARRAKIKPRPWRI